MCFEKISYRIQNLCFGLKNVTAAKVEQQVISGLVSGMTTVQLDELAAETAASMASIHPEYDELAVRTAVSNLHKSTANTFIEAFGRLHALNMVPDDLWNIAFGERGVLEEAMDQNRDFELTYFGFKTLEKSYLLRNGSEIIERPQYLWMRVALGIHGSDIDSVLQTYDLMSRRLFSHATPTLFSAGTVRPQLSSCFLLTVNEDSISGIFDSLKECALISKASGGIGINVSKVRARGTRIESTNGKSNGLVPMLRVFNNTARYVDQGGGKRPGAIAVYVEPWHADIFEFLDLKKNTGKDELRARELFYGLWIPDLFMKRVKENGTWSLFCPHQFPNLDSVYGEEFDEMYCRYEEQSEHKFAIPAQDLWHQIIESQVETGTPYLLYKDACNRKSNQKYLGTITNSNLCTEIVQYCSPDEIAVCNLASIAVNMFVKNSSEYDFELLGEVVEAVTRNLNKVIDITSYPLEKARISNMKHRPIAIGVQGLADAFLQLHYAYDSAQARKLNQQIFETIYYHALKASVELPGHHYRFGSSPASKGILQFDMWDKKPSDMYDWDALKARISEEGLRNSLLVGPMPTASTAQILGNNESIEPYTSNIYARRVMSGEFTVVNRHLVKDLFELGLWDEQMRNEIIADRGSVQKIERIPAYLRLIHRTAWEIPMKSCIDMAVDRGAFIDQSQSFNVHVAEPSYAKLTSMYFYGWERGLKTGSYYLRTKPAANAIQFTVDKGDSSNVESNVEMCQIGCTSCSG